MAVFLRSSRQVCFEAPITFIKFSFLIASLVVLPASYACANLMAHDTTVNTTKTPVFNGNVLGNATNDAGVSTYTTNVRYLTPDGYARAVQKLFGLVDLPIPSIDKDIATFYRDSGIVFDFELIEGNTYGTASGDFLLHEPVTETNNLTITLPQFVQTQEIISNNQINTYGQPVQFARLATTAHETKNQSLDFNFNGALFLDASDLSPLMLVYASAPMQIKHRGTVGITETIYDVSIPNAGWHWIKTFENEHSYLIQVVERDTIDPAILAF